MKSLLLLLSLTCLILPPHDSKWYVNEALWASKTMARQIRRTGTFDSVLWDYYSSCTARAMDERARELGIR